MGLKIIEDDNGLYTVRDGRGIALLFSRSYNLTQKWVRMVEIGTDYDDATALLFSGQSL